MYAILAQTRLRLALVPVLVVITPFQGTISTLSEVYFVFLYLPNATSVTWPAPAPYLHTVFIFRRRFLSRCVRHAVSRPCWRLDGHPLEGIHFRKDDNFPLNWSTCTHISPHTTLNRTIKIQ